MSIMLICMMERGSRILLLVGSWVVSDGITGSGSSITCHRGRCRCRSWTEHAIRVHIRTRERKSREGNQGRSVSTKFYVNLIYIFIVYNLG